VILASQLPFLVRSRSGRRPGPPQPPQTLARLGYDPIYPKQLGVVALFAVSAFAQSLAADHLFS
jgi:hypothetical protein